MAKTNKELYKSTTAGAYKPYHQVFSQSFLALTIMQSVETQRIQNSHHNLKCIICNILRGYCQNKLGMRIPKRKYSWTVEIADYEKCRFVKFCYQFKHNVVRFRPVLSNTDRNSTSKHFFSTNEQCCLLATGVDMD